jgi:hypothetical protein
MNEYYSSESNDNYDSDDSCDSNDNYDGNDEIAYEPGEVSKTKFNIVLCVLYNGHLHGNTDLIVNTHYLTLDRFKPDVWWDVIRNLYKSYNARYNRLLSEPGSENWSDHLVIRNYKNIVSSKNYIKPEIAECLYLKDDEESVSIIKTIWIRLIQRTWKKIFNLRKEVLLKRCKIESFRHREIHGNWPTSCDYLPTISGMLSKLSKRNLVLK